MLYLSPIVRWKLLNRSLFYVAGDHKSYFIPGLVGPFLEMTLIPHSGEPNCWCKTHSFVSLLIKPLIIIIWLNPRAGKVKRILRSDWLPERRRWARPVFPAWDFSVRVSRERKGYLFGHTIMNMSKWLDAGLVLFCVFINLDYEGPQ